MNKMIIIIVALVLILGGGGAAVFFFVLGGEEGPPPPPVIFSPGDFFIVNVKDSNRLLKTAVLVAVSGERAHRGLPDRLEEDMYVVRDTIIFILRELTEDKIRLMGAEDEVRSMLVAGLNEKFDTDGIVDILFTEFVIQ